MSNLSSEFTDDVSDTLKENNMTEEDQLTLRALVSTKEAGVIIGKGGRNVADLRDSTGVKAGVSKVVQGVHDRVLTVSGSLEAVAKAYSLIARTMAENPISNNTNTLPTSPTSAQPVITLRLLVSHNLMGTVIGRQGAKIKHIQDISGVRMTASKTLLPQSTERVVEVRGTVEAIEQAVSEIGQCLIEDKDRAYGTILYSPTKAVSSSSTAVTGDRRTSITRTGNGTDFSNGGSLLTGNLDYDLDQQPQQPFQRRRSSAASAFNNNNNSNNPDVRTQHISIPSDMVGCIIGKGGSKISEIRRLSGSHISIAKMPHDETGERMFTIQGTPEANERALYLLYGQLENEKERRLRGSIAEDILEEE